MGFTSNRLRNAALMMAQWEEVDRINEELGNTFTLLKGIECDILEDATMDLPDDVLAEAAIRRRVSTRPRSICHWIGNGAFICNP